MLLKKLRSALKAGLRKVDLFPTTQFIKFNKQSEYKTATGGFVSVGLIIIIFILFSSKGIQTLDRSIINSSVSSRIDIQPSPLKVITSPKGGFMFGIGILGVNLNDPSVTYFEISLFQNYFSPLMQIINSTQIPMVQCTSAHFSFNKDILDMYAKFNLTQSLCPPLDYVFEIGGRITSSIYSQFNVFVKKCNSAITGNCVSDAVIASIGQLTLTVPVVNTIVNPNDEVYMQTFIEDRNYFSFTTTYGININAQIAQEQIDTDVSIMPYTQTITEFITTVPNLFTSRSAQVVGTTYALLSFSKSSTMTTYSRSFSKLDDYLSYTGGLIGTGLLLFFLLNAYSERSYLVDLAIETLATSCSDCPLKDFNFLNNLGIMVKNWLGAVNIEMKWERGQILIKSMQEMEEQLDIGLLMKKICFLEEAISSILSDHQLDALYLKNKRSLEMVQKWREKHRFFQAISNSNTTERTNLEIRSQDSMNSQLFEGQNNKELFGRLRTSVQKVIHQSKEQNLVSARILEKIDSDTLQRLGISFPGENQVIQLKQKKASQSQSSNPNISVHSKNVIFNDFREIPNRKELETFVLQYDQM